MDIIRTLLLVACIGFGGPARAASSAYDLLIFSCRNGDCSRLEQNVRASTSNQTEYALDGLRLLIETLERRANEEDARISVNVRPADGDRGTSHPAPAAWVQGLEVLVVQCKLRPGMFSPLTTFIRDGTTYQIWGRLTAMH